MANFVVSGLSNYVQENHDMIVKNVLFGGDLLRHIRIQTGVKKDENIHILDVNPTFQDGTNCGWNQAGTATITERKISTGAIKVNMSICPETLLGKYAEYLVRIGAKSEEFPFEQYVMEGLVTAINKKTQKALWLGDTSSNDSDLKWYNGFVTIAEADSNVIDVSISSGKTAYQGLLQVAASIPEEVIERGAIIYCSPAIFNAFMQDLVSANLYHYNPADGQAMEFPLPGTNILVRKNGGLSGSLKVFATYDDNMYFGCDAEGDREEVKAFFSNDNDEWRLIVKWNAGVNYAFGDQVVLGVFAATPSSSTLLGDKIDTIATNTGTIATNTGTVATNTGTLADADHVYKTKEQE